MARTGKSLLEMANHEDNQMDLDEHEASKTIETQVSGGGFDSTSAANSTSADTKAPSTMNAGKNTNRRAVGIGPSSGLANKTRHPSNPNIKKPRILERSLDQDIDRAKAHGLNFSRPF